MKNFIVLEGLDGAGTTTQGKLFRERCEKEGISAVFTCEPTGNPIGRTIRTILQGAEKAHPRTMSYLFAADRHEHVHGSGGILDNLDRGSIVVCDRYLFSSLAYQSIDCGFDTVFALNSSFPLPELLVFLDVTPKVGDDRLVSRAKREIYEYPEFQEKVRGFYDRALNAYRDSPMRILRLDGEKAPAGIHEDIWSFFKKLR